jgi:uncharacterized protein
MTSSREFDANRLDVETFAAEGAVLHGEWPLRDLPRLRNSAATDVPLEPTDVVRWKARGERVPNVRPELWLHLEADTSIALQCQRCLAPVEVGVVVDRRFGFVAGEAAAAALDATSDDDIIALTRALDLTALIEDELLLALPLVPMHAVCPSPLAIQDAGRIVDEAASPFAALAALKSPRNGTGTH